jgi:hypothetical protein
VDVDVVVTDVADVETVAVDVVARMTRKTLGKPFTIIYLFCFASCVRFL